MIPLGKVRMQLARTIKDYRKKHNMTQKEFGEFVGISTTTVSNYETGKFIPDLILLKKMREKLGLDDDLNIKSKSEEEEAEEGGNL